VESGMENYDKVFFECAKTRKLRLGSLANPGRRGNIGDIEDKLPVFYEDLSDVISVTGEAPGL
jgi:hypothetical protein